MEYLSWEDALMSKPKIIWAAGLLLSSSCFLAYEIPAARNDTPGDTLSEFIWWAASQHPIIALTIAFITTGLAIWLPFHFNLRGSWPDRVITGLLQKLIRRKD